MAKHGDGAALYAVQKDKTAKASTVIRRHLPEIMARSQGNRDEVQRLIWTRCEHDSDFRNAVLRWASFALAFAGPGVGGRQ